MPVKAFAASTVAQPATLLMSLDWNRMGLKLRLRKTWAVIQLALLGAVYALAENDHILPLKYRIAVIAVVGALQSVLPSPITRTKDNSEK